MMHECFQWVGTLVSLAMVEMGGPARVAQASAILLPGNPRGERGKCV